MYVTSNYIVLENKFHCIIIRNTIVIWIQNTLSGFIRIIIFNKWMQHLLKYNDHFVRVPLLVNKVTRIFSFLFAYLITECNYKVSWFLLLLKTREIELIINLASMYNHMLLLIILARRRKTNLSVKLKIWNEEVLWRWWKQRDRKEATCRQEPCSSIGLHVLVFPNERSRVYWEKKQSILEIM